MLTGRVNSFQSMGTLDGPGLRCVVFMQGCPLRCSCCHNPETWDISGGTEYTSVQLFDKIYSFRNYIRDGGVTASGGEPLLQAKFLTELFELCHKASLHTALDTSGCIINADVISLLEVTDLIILDYKMNNADDYLKYTKCSIEKPERFLKLLDDMRKPVWLRQVHIPTINSSDEDIRHFFDKAKEYSCVEKAELLPFRKLCLEKYRSMGIAFPFEDIPEADESIRRIKS